MIPGTNRAMKRRKTMIPTSMLSAQIERSLETANLTAAPRLACPFVICSEASLTALPSAIVENTTFTTKITTRSRSSAPNKCGEIGGELLRRGIDWKIREDEGLLCQRSDDLDDHSHYRKENEIFRKVSPVNVEGFRDDLAETQFASNTLLRLHRHVNPSDMAAFASCIKAEYVSQRQERRSLSKDS